MTTHTPNPFVQIETIHRASVEWWWSDRKLHDDEYKRKVQDAVDAAVRKAESQFDVRNNIGFCCQWEGIELQSFDLGAVTAAAQMVGAVLARFKDVRPLEL